MYKAEILADSVAPSGDRITTMKITFPRIVLAEFNTHRLFSRNSASSRAIPLSKMVKMVEENPFIPIAWQKNHKGMQGNEYITSVDDRVNCWREWMEVINSALKSALYLNSDLDVTKQLANRLLEPFMWHTVIVTATEWENFFKLRCPQYKYLDSTEPKGYGYCRSWKDYCKKLGYDHTVEGSILDRLNLNESQADIHIQAIAELMWDALNESEPKVLQEGQWHIPFGDNIDIQTVKEYLKVKSVANELGESIIGAGSRAIIKIATARCARISYQTLGDDPKINYEADIKLHDRLLKEEHMSPFEHCARVMSNEEYYSSVKGKIKLQSNWGSVAEGHEMYGWCNNFRGFTQYRYLVENSI